MRNKILNKDDYKKVPDKLSIMKKLMEVYLDDEFHEELQKLIKEIESQAKL